MNHLYEWNARLYEWQRVDRIQEYKGIKIETLTVHDDSDKPRNHREYRITYKDGSESYFRINKRGGNIEAIKELIDSMEGAR